MFKRKSTHDSGRAGFLPEDYLERRRERRTNALSIFLFVVVVFGVVGAFFVTNSQWNEVRAHQNAINVRYTQAAQDIEQLKQLEAQEGQLLQKAELATALIERVPRSVLFAELINRMPRTVKLLETQLVSARLDKPIEVKLRAPASADPGKTGRGSSITSKSKSSSGASDKDAKPAAPVITAPQYQTRVIMIGVAPSNTEVAQYVSALQQCGLLKDVELIFSETTIIEDLQMNKFRIEAMLRPEADARRIEPIQRRRIDAFDPLSSAPEGLAPFEISSESASVEEEER